MENTELAKPMPAESGWKRQTPPELYKFDKPGDMIAGILVGVYPAEITDQASGEKKQVVEYLLQAVDGRQLKFRATYDLFQKLKAQHRGHGVRIKYLGEDPGVRRGNNNMKLFDVLVREEREKGGPEISDADIPF